MKEVWNQSREIAVVSYVLAMRLPHLSPDQAMLTGLMHNIGVLPLCQYIEKNNNPVTDESLANIIAKCSRTIGNRLLIKWNFPKEIIDAVAECDDIHRESSKAPRADYSDVVMFANLQQPSRAKVVAWENITAVKRLGLSEMECMTFLESNAARIEQVKSLLGINPTVQPRVNTGIIPPSQNFAAPQATRPNKKKGGLLAFLLRLWR
jgi:HD-like signal output (HDOD) protein